MNYLVTHYKNLAEQLQARINHIQQCLYEMDAAAGGGIDQLRVDDSVSSYVNPNSYNYGTGTTNTPNVTQPNYPPPPGPPYTTEPIPAEFFGENTEPDYRDYSKYPLGKRDPQYLVDKKAWDRATASYNKAVRIYQAYVRARNRRPSKGINRF